MAYALARLTESLKILGQNTPSANTATTLYTVPASTTANVGYITVCNTNAGGTVALVRVWFAVAGASDTTKQYMYYDFPVDGTETLVTPGATLGAADLIRIQSDTANVAFQAFGSEVT